MRASDLGPGLGRSEGEGSTPSAPGPAQDLRVLTPGPFQNTVCRRDCPGPLVSQSRPHGGDVG